MTISIALVNCISCFIHFFFSVYVPANGKDGGVEQVDETHLQTPRANVSF